MKIIMFASYMRFIHKFTHANKDLRDVYYYYCSKNVRIHLMSITPMISNEKIYGHNKYALGTRKKVVA